MWVFHEYVTERVCDNVLFHREFDIFLKNCYISKTVGDRAFLKHCKRNMKWNLNFKAGPEIIFPSLTYQQLPLVFELNLSKDMTLTGASSTRSFMILTLSRVGSQMV